MSIELTNHNGTTILIIDYTRAKNLQEMSIIIDEAAEFMRDSPAALLTLSDFTGLTVTAAFLQRAKALGREVFQAKTERGAVVGLSASMKIMLNAYNNFTKNNMVAFETRTEAFAYLMNM